MITEEAPFKLLDVTSVPGDEELEESTYLERLAFLLQLLEQSRLYQCTVNVISTGAGQSKGKSFDGRRQSLAWHLLR